jgi:hypothetical protein
MPDIEMPDPEDLGGNVTKPFKFVTGSCLYTVQTETTHIADFCGLAGAQALILRLPCVVLLQATSRCAYSPLLPHHSSWRHLLTSFDGLQATMHASPIKTSTSRLVVICLCDNAPLTVCAGPSTAGKTMSIITNVSWPRGRISDPADKYACPTLRAPSYSLELR